jgi:hypothetical protein
MGMAREASTTPRVRAVASFLAEGLRAIQHTLAPLE